MTQQEIDSYVNKMTQEEYISFVKQAKADSDACLLPSPSMETILYLIGKCEQQHPEWKLPDTDTFTFPDANSEDATTEDHERAPFWLVILAILYIIGEVIMFIPLALLALFGISKHPFMGYFFFRDLMRKK